VAYIPVGYTQEAAVTKSTVFKTNRTQAVRIPRELAFPDDVKEVEITRHGNSLIVVPKGGGWKEFFENAPHVSDDFLADRMQGEPDEREPL
jgi:antitoxin VapB